LVSRLARSILIILSISAADNSNPMKNLFGFIFVLCTIVFIFTYSANGQEIAKSRSSSALSQVANGAGKVTVIVLGSAAKFAWGTTRFAAKNAAMPLAKSVVKPLLFKLTPKLTVFALKLSGKTVKKAVPVATKVGYAYLKTKLPV